MNPLQQLRRKLAEDIAALTAQAEAADDVLDTTNDRAGLAALLGQMGQGCGPPQTLLADAGYAGEYVPGVPEFEHQCLWGRGPHTPFV